MLANPAFGGRGRLAVDHQLTDAVMLVQAPSLLAAACVPGTRAVCTSTIVGVKRRPSAEDRFSVLRACIDELVNHDWTLLAARAPSEPGMWPIGELTVRRDDVDVRVCFRRPHGQGDLQVIVNASAERSFRRVVIDGFALRGEHTPEPLTSAEWEELNF